MCSIEKGVPRRFAEFKEKYLCQSLFFNKAAGQACKKSLNTVIFLWILQNF